MNYPKEFYSSQTRAGEKLTDVPTADMDVNALLRKEHKYYIDVVGCRENKPKKLILSDWTARNWSLEKLAEVMGSLGDMLDQGFEIYLWQSHLIKTNGEDSKEERQFKLLTKENLQDLASPAVRGLITPESPEVIRRHAYKAIKQSTHANLWVMDDYWLERALHADEPDKPMKRVIRINDFTALKPSLSSRSSSSSSDSLGDLMYHWKRKVMELSKTIKPPVEEIVCDELSIDLLFAYRALAKDAELPGFLRAEFNFSHLNLSKYLCYGKGIGAYLWSYNSERVGEQGQAKAAFDGIAPILELLENNGLHNVLKNFKAISIAPSNQFDINMDENWNLEQVSSLILLHEKMTTNHYRDVQPSSNFLGRILLAGNQITAPDLKKLLMATPQIEEMDFRGCKNIHDAFVDLPPNYFLKLKKVCLQASNITAKSLVALLNAAPNIEELDLSYCQNLLGISVASVSIRELKNLKKLNLAHTEAEAVDMVMLKRLVPNLTELSIKGCKLDKSTGSAGTVFVCNLRWENLKNLSLEAMYLIKMQEITTILENCPQLEELDLSFCTATYSYKEVKERDDLNKSIQHLTKEKLSGLKKLKMPCFASPGLQQVEVAHILEHASNLEEISLKSVDLDLFESIDGNCKLPNLTKLSFRTRPDDRLLDKSVLDDFLLKAPNLDVESRRALLELTVPKILEVTDAQKKSTNKKPIAKVQQERPAAKKTIDANTDRDPNKKFTLNHIFDAVEGSKNPWVGSYRIGAYNKLTLNPSVCSINNAFTIENESNQDLQLVECQSQLRNEDIFRLAKNEFKNARFKRFSNAIRNKEPATSPFFGRQQFDLDNEWQPIASLSPNEIMRYHRIIPHNAQIELAYSKRDNLYYIKSVNGAETIQFYFVVEVIKQKKLPANIENLRKVFLKFGAKKIEFEKPENERTGLTYLNAILEKKMGACRHRAIAFKAIIDNDYPNIPCRIITNHCHAYVEVNIDGEWLNCDLGGYEASLEVYKVPELSVQAEVPAPASLLATPMVQATAVVPSLKPYNAPIPIPPRAPNPYDGSMQTWVKHAVEDSPIDPLQFCKDLVLPVDNKTKRLIRLGSREAVNTVVLRLQQHCKSINRPYFYIHSPSDVICSKNFIQRDGNSGRVTKGPGGPLYDFLTGDYRDDNPPVIIINYANFTAEEIVALNGFLDPEARADGTPIPVKALKLGVMNSNDSEAYEDTDLHSRFDIKESRLINKLSLEDWLKPLPIYEKSKEVTPESQLNPEPQQNSNNSVIEKNKTIINLYRANDWKSQLLGHWTMTAQGLYFEEGLLKDALSTGEPIEIQNGLWDDPEFIFFWKQASVLSEISYQDEIIPTPNLIIHTSDGYDWAHLQSRFKPQSPQFLIDSKNDQPINDNKAPLHFLNPSQLGFFFGGYHYNDEEKTLIKSDGFIKEAHDANSETLSVHLTSPLNDDQWARLLSACDNADVTLEVTIPSTMSLPEHLQNLVLRQELVDLSTPEPVVWDRNTHLRRHIIQSSEPDTTIAILTQQDTAWQVIDVSECKSSDLFIETKPIKGENELDLQFSQNEMAVLKALKDNQKVILTGKISPQLADALAPYLLPSQNRHENEMGSLLVVSKDISLLYYSTPHVNLSQHQVSLPDKIPFLKPATQLSEEPLAILKSREAFSDGMSSLFKLDFRLEDLGEWNDETLQNSLEKTENYFQERNRQLDKYLFHPEHPSPYIFITGLSGVGKTTFIEEELRKGEPHKIHMGEGKMEEWINDDSQGPKYLFIDEANLSPRQWTDLEGIYTNTPPKVLINGKLYTLTPQHKIIFAGNPLNYGDDREVSPFFLRHPCTTEFKPLPLFVIYERILKPVFENVLAPDDMQAISKPILDIYTFLCGQSSIEVLISPRELQMMALLTVSYCKEMAGLGFEVDKLQVATHFAYALAKPLMPVEKLAAFETKYGIVAPSIQPLPLPIDKINESPDFKVTDSRLPLLSKLENLLILRENRQEATNNKQQKFGGLGGIILEGDSSVGKSTMVLALLRAHNFEEVHQVEGSTNKLKPFYRMDIGKPQVEKEKLLINAFYEGAVVVIDEINTASMERLLNDLLMGNVPPKYQRPLQAVKPGFMVIGTQNPPTMAGRRAHSTALLRRFMFEKVPNYPQEDILEILVAGENYSSQKMIELNLLAESFVYNAKIAKENNFTPAPTLRAIFHIRNEIKVSEDVVSNVLTPNLTPIPIRKIEQKPTKGHSCSYFIFKAMEAAAIMGGIALVVTGIAFTLGLAAIIAGGALIASVGILEVGSFFKNKCIRPEPIPDPNAPVLGS